MGSVVPTEFADHQRKAMLRAIHEREGRWNEVDPDTEVARIGEGIGLGEDKSYKLFGHLVDEGFVEPGRAYRAGGAMPGSTSRIVGREGNMTVIGDDVRLTSKGRALDPVITARLRGRGPTSGCCRDRLRVSRRRLRQRDYASTSA